MRLVLDTSVIISAMRSRRGASSQLLESAFSRKFDWLLSNTLYLEYQDVLSRSEHRQAAGMSTADITSFLDAVLIATVFVDLGYYRRPVLRDAGDEHVLNLCLSGRADALVTYNLRDFMPTLPGQGVDLLTPTQAQHLLGTLDAEHE